MPRLDSDQDVQVSVVDGLGHGSAVVTETSDVPPGSSQVSLAVYGNRQNEG